MTSTKEETVVVRVRKCSICREPGHMKNKCPDRTDTVQKDLDTIVNSVEVIGVCKFQPCKQNVDHFANGDFCSQSCEMFFNSTKANSGKARSHYKDEYATTKFYEYIRKCERSHLLEYTEVKDEKGDVVNMIPKNQLQLPSLAGYAMFLGHVKIVLRQWATKHDEFRNTMLQLKQIQESYLINNGMSGRYNNTITKLALMNNHGMKEKKEVTNEHLIGVVKDVYERADALESGAEDPFEGDDSDNEE